MRTKLKMNKKGTDMPSILFVIAMVFAIGIVVVLVSHLAIDIYGSINDAIDDNSRLTGGQANTTLTEVIEFEQTMWDYFFLAIVIGYVLSMTILSFTTPTNPWLFSIFAVFGMLGLFVGVALSNAWQKMAEQPTLAETIARFPITDLILGNFYPLFITLMLVLVMIMLFGKRFLGGSGGR